MLACGASLALCPVLQAQDATPTPDTAATPAASPHSWGNHMLARLTKELDLTTDEQAKIKPILEDAHTQMQSIHQDTTLSDEDKRSKMKEARDSLNSAINAQLTPDQQTKFAAWQAKMHSHHHGADASPASSASPSSTP